MLSLSLADDQARINYPEPNAIRNGDIYLWHFQIWHPCPDIPFDHNPNSWSNGSDTDEPTVSLVLIHLSVFTLNPYDAQWLHLDNMTYICQLHHTQNNSDCECHRQIFNMAFTWFDQVRTELFSAALVDLIRLTRLKTKRIKWMLKSHNRPKWRSSPRPGTSCILTSVTEIVSDLIRLIQKERNICFVHCCG